MSPLLRDMAIDKESTSSIVQLISYRQHLFLCEIDDLTKILTWGVYSCLFNTRVVAAFLESILLSKLACIFLYIKGQVNYCFQRHYISSIEFHEIWFFRRKGKVHMFRADYLRVVILLLSWRQFYKFIWLTSYFLSKYKKWNVQKILY